MGVRRRLNRRNSSVSSEELSVQVSKLQDDIQDKIPFARKKKPDSRVVLGLQLILVLALITLSVYVYYFFDDFHLHVTKFYAHQVEDHHALHRMGHHMLKENRNTTAAMEYFRKSAELGHPESAYNLAAGHLSGFKTDVRKGEVQDLLRFAADNGVIQARNLLEGLCKDKPNHCQH